MCCFGAPLSHLIHPQVYEEVEVGRGGVIGGECLELPYDEVSPAVRGVGG